MRSDTVTTRVGDRRLRLSNLDKVLYPEEGFTKAEVIDYYARIAPVLLPHLRGRPLTLRRYPDGVEADSFFEKDVSRHAPPWVRTVRVPTPGSGKGAEAADFAVIDDLPTLVWVANLASLELHVPQWTVGPRGGPRDPDLLVFDLDPGAPATVVECCRVAERLRELLEADDLTAWPKTSGSKGLQLYVPVSVPGPERTSEYARAAAELLARQTPRQVVATMAKQARHGKVFIDWSQNNPKKTTVAPYSLRARPRPTVSTPVTWEEVAACARPEDLVFTAPEVLDRVDEHGDLFDGVLGPHARRSLPARPSAAS
ncbi:bifunctional non-homologous end joining protein LigD [Streptoalloteichus tenebrarius]|uniref:Bifunctional non-homologous end joining protein LigD n=1 Tax=Streptoalloteichus tenebrarius (strain ATCC 17920 / DSM 40477 / JCM 4838 / CBS 697.72 / NBRC 16177 / NCIMB 11028 / NRRL B-12390 / A12253. 1 / ISP 5477) TaxID=1933 RepID=A0ABT1HQ68_STRSD|nr:non-homologous end-joining DNA ligase [Streptoalloteichus tenebrarius]MCP2257638.1 bifunctional non-homologous end joining protein LigD [Streptoalloteichus tenebrarius]BFE98598.1 non-homologous end-joining DNA ligase [Streptoalloteichus tenebrarius]